MLQHGADINAKNYSAENGDPNVVDFLANHVANKFSRNANQEIPVDIAKKCTSILEISKNNHKKSLFKYDSILDQYIRVL